MTEPGVENLGLSGWLAAKFQDNPLTPILAIAGLLLGLAAVLVTPREEEPQIDVTMANVMVPFAGASARDVETLVSGPLEQVLSEIEGVKHVYSVSRPGMAVVTVEFVVGVQRQPAIVRLYNQVYSNQDWLPSGLGVGQPLVKPMGIDDVPVMAVTLWTDDPARSAVELAEVAHALEPEIKRVAGTRDVYTLGAPDRAVLVELDGSRLANYGLTAADVEASLRAANTVLQAGDRVTALGNIPVTAGRFLVSSADVAQLVLGLSNGKPVTIADIARVSDGGDVPRSIAWHGSPAGRSGPVTGFAPAVTIAIAKKPGSNAADITQAVATRLDALKGQLIPAGIEVRITRDYGQTATDKAQKLITKLVFATGSVVLLVLFALGWREAIVVGSAVVLTLAVTLFASWAMGFTLNRVSLFALIFSIGILVDDAIVVVENIHRHMARGGKSLRDAIPGAVAEVGGPTILATFTVIAALLPMAFVSGLMGPYMRPIPINASVGMLISLAIALVVTPWLSLKLLARHSAPTTDQAAHAETLVDSAPASRLHRLFSALIGPFIRGPRASRHRKWLLAAIALLMALAAALAVFELVVLKMLPFDNKSELQVIVDMPEGSTLEQTNGVLVELATATARVPEVLDFQAYVGTSAPVNFNGLVRQYYLRSGANVGDLQVNLVDKHARERKSHDIARALRPALAAIGRRHGASIKVVEVPPGPPVLSPLVAEVYGPDAEGRRAVALALRERFAKTAGIVDIDTSLAASSEREVLVLDRARAARLGISQAAAADAIAMAISGRDATYLHDGVARVARPVRLRLAASAQADLDRLLALPLRSGSGALVPLSQLVRREAATWDDAITHKDLLPVVYVTGDEAGALDSPLYGMFDVVGQISRGKIAGKTLTQYYLSPPAETTDYAVKWDGEWQITYETFRDMGLAYSVGLMLIYLLVVVQFRSYVVPLVIMAPIPLTVIGVMPGHALLGAQFTATSMIGMIALAGIIVRNSILLVDFINQSIAEGKPLADAVVEACAVRAQPIVLTGVAAMMGAFFILDDPIFNGLAIALIFGILVSTVLTLLVIPVLYFAWLNHLAKAQGDLS